MDRTPKFPLEEIAAATRGDWRERRRRAMDVGGLAGTRHEQAAPPFDDD